MTSRIAGLDVARGLAILGMVAAHVGDDASTDGVGWPWLVATHGRSSALFAVLAGVTMSLMLARGDDAGGAFRTRVRIATRAGILVVLGLLLTELGTPVDIILVNLGLMMLLALPLLRAPSWALLAIAGGAIAGGWWYVPRLAETFSESLPVLGRLWSTHYPALSWIGYVLIGVVVGRLPLAQARTQALLVGAGLAVASAAVLVRAVAGEGPVTSLEPHSYTPVEMVHNAGVAVLVIGACCWLATVAPAARAALAPLAALGSMALTAYVGHLLVIAAIGPEAAFQPSNVTLVVLCTALLAIAWAWRTWLSQGPLERVLTLASNAAGDRAVRAREQAERERIA